MSLFENVLELLLGDYLGLKGPDYYCSPVIFVELWHRWTLSFSSDFWERIAPANILVFL